MLTSFRKITCSALAAWAIGLISVDALVIRGYTPSKHDRIFNTSSTPSLNPDFIHAGIDLTGVGWHTAVQSRQLTMVSPLHFIGARHYRPGIGATLRFVANDGNFRDFTVASQTTITNDSDDISDLFIGTLTAPIATTQGIRHLPYLNLSLQDGFRPYRNYLGKTTMVLGKTTRGANGRIDIIQDRIIEGVSTKMITWSYDTNSGDADDSYLESGDSGSPVFVEQDGVAAIVATHSGVSGPDSNGIITNISSFTPHYVDKLNIVMEAQGYHMTKAIPGNTILNLNHQLPSGPFRAGHPIPINLTIENTGGTLAENIKVKNSFSLPVTNTSTHGTEWFDESGATTANTRRATLTSSGSSTCQITVTPTTPGIYQHQTTYFSDQSSLVSETFSVSVIESFLSWANGLTDQTSQGDDDQDNISNLLEYAFGGDPTTNSQTFPSTSIPLLPTHTRTDNTFSLTYLRRTDYQTRALNYAIHSSTSLETDSWSDASSLVSQTTVTPLTSDFEQVTLNLSPTTTPQFFCIEVTLSE